MNVTEAVREFKWLTGKLRRAAEMKDVLRTKALIDAGGALSVYVEDLGIKVPEDVSKEYEDVRYGVAEDMLEAAGEH